MQETADLQKRLEEAEGRVRVAAEESMDLRKAVQDAMEVADAAKTREEEALQQQYAAIERESSALERQAEWKKAAEAAAVLAEASIAEANTAKIAASSARAELQEVTSKAAPVESSPHACRSPGQTGADYRAGSPRTEHLKHKVSPSLKHHPERPSPGKEVRDRDSALKALSKLQQRLWDRCSREADAVHGSPGDVGVDTAGGGSQQVKRKRSERRAPRGGPAGGFNVVEALEDVLMHEKQLMKHQCEAAKAAESQGAEVSAHAFSIAPISFFCTMFGVKCSSFAEIRMCWTDLFCCEP